MKLYEITQTYLDIIDQFADPDVGDDFDSMAEAFNAVTDGFNDKAENIGCLIKETQATAAAIADEIKALQARKRTADNKAEFLKNYLCEQMEAIGAKKIETPRAVLTRRKSSYVNVFDQEKIEERHPEFIKIKIDKAIDKRELAKALKGGAYIEGADMRERESLVIK